MPEPISTDRDYGFRARAFGAPRNDGRGIERIRHYTSGLRLARYFGTTLAFWMGMQAQYDIERAADTLAGELKRVAPAKRTAA
jgi:antitoxin HigA-1